MSTAYWLGALSVVVLIGIAMLVEWTPNPWKAIVGLVDGYDHRLSTSKFQWFLWTFVVIFAYVTLFAMRVQRGSLLGIGEIPGSVVLALGLSAGTMTVAKGITTAQAKNGQVATQASGQASAGDLVTDDTGQTDLSKVQLIGWTLVAIVVFLIAVGHSVRALNALPAGICSSSAKTIPDACNTGLPDIDQALVVLMGLGQAAYVGKKLVSAGTPTLVQLSKTSAVPGVDTISVVGTCFGAQQNGSVITFDGQHDQIAGNPWTDNKITFQVPGVRPDGSNWPAGCTDVRVGLIVNGNPSANTLPLSVGNPPTITSVAPGAGGSVGQEVTVTGSNLTRTTSVMIGTLAASTFDAVSDTQVTFMVPAGAKTGKVQVVTPCGSAQSPNDFVVAP